MSWLNSWKNIFTAQCLLCLFPQTLFFKTPVSCRLVRWNGIQEYPDQPQDACRSHAWRRTPSAQHSHQQPSVLPLPVVFQWQPAQCDLTMMLPYDCASLLYREHRATAGFYVLSQKPLQKMLIQQILIQISYNIYFLCKTRHFFLLVIHSSFFRILVGQRFTCNNLMLIVPFKANPLTASLFGIMQLFAQEGGTFCLTGRFCPMKACPQWKLAYIIRNLDWARRKTHWWDYYK